jgi:hypothetical protein
VRTEVYIPFVGFCARRWILKGARKVASALVISAGAVGRHDPIQVGFGLSLNLAFRFGLDRRFSGFRRCFLGVLGFRYFFSVGFFDVRNLIKVPIAP